MELGVQLKMKNKKQNIKKIFSLRRALMTLLIMIFGILTLIIQDKNFIHRYFILFCFYTVAYLVAYFLEEDN